ncbi:hypothetical protein SAMN05428953_14510 [Mesorhizobium muleiense]|uniref:Uncharacterized protein n=1 Tax=Mesorhizobium muleiense TaxID=1004279 RepID=A0A1G9L1I6_9HYPH|nr:hypothetical protein SAMN05428953_14510 [Mesorhizobium muleiense]
MMLLKLVRALLAYKRASHGVFDAANFPHPDEEDRRRITRERMALTNERVHHVNRIKGLLFTPGVSGYEPLHRDQRLAGTGDAAQSKRHRAGVRILWSEGLSRHFRQRTTGCHLCGLAPTPW